MSWRLQHSYIPTRATPGAFASDDAVRQLIPALLHARPDRLLWGSDWPHTPKHDHKPVMDAMPSAFRPIDTGRLLDHVAAMFADARALAQVFRDNPRALLNWD